MAYIIFHEQSDLSNGVLISQESCVKFGSDENKEFFSIIQGKEFIASLVFLKKNDCMSVKDQGPIS